jgi:hypothetical protein
MQRGGGGSCSVTRGDKGLKSKSSKGKGKSKSKDNDKPRGGWRINNKELLSGIKLEERKARNQC